MDSVNLFFVKILKHLPISDQNNAIRGNIIQRYMENVNVSYCDQLSLCRVCGNNYFNNPMHRHLVPPKKINRFLRRLIQNKPQYGTKYQMRALQKIQKIKNKQTVVTVCRFCKINKTKRTCAKPFIRKQLEPDSKYTEEVRKSVFKKAKKSSQFAGLNKAAVLAVKRAGEAINSDNMVTPKRQKLDSSVIVLDTPPSNNSKQSKLSTANKNIPHKKQSKLSKAKEANTKYTPNEDKSIICISDSPIQKTKEHDIINLVTPKAKSSKKKNKNKTKTLTNSYKSKNNIANFLKQNEKLDKTISTLEQFLKSVS